MLKYLLTSAALCSLPHCTTVFKQPPSEAFPCLFLLSSHIQHVQHLSYQMTHSWTPSPAQRLLWKVCWNQQQQKSPSPLKNPGLSHTAEHQPKGCHISVPGFQEASVMLCPHFADGLCLETHGIYCAYTDHLPSVQTKGPWLLEMLDTSHVLQSKSGHVQKMHLNFLLCLNHLWNPEQR